MSETNPPRALIVDEDAEINQQMRDELRDKGIVFVGTEDEARCITSHEILPRPSIGIIGHHPRGRIGSVGTMAMMMAVAMGAGMPDLPPRRGMRPEQEPDAIMRITSHKHERHQGEKERQRRMKRRGKP